MNKGGPWTNDELKASVIAYGEMLSMQSQGKPYSKKTIYRRLADQFGRTEGAFEYRMQNISHVLNQLGKEWIPGLPPATNVGEKVTSKLEQMLAEAGLSPKPIAPNNKLSDEKAAAAIIFADDPELKDESPTTKAALVEARLGQGTFRKNLLKLWGGKCAVTGCAVEQALIASHSIPWKDATNKQRLDPFNGLPLVATLDALFDVGLIAFTDEGVGLISKHLSNDDRDSLGLSVGMKLRTVYPQNKPYLAAHRKRFGFAD